MRFKLPSRSGFLAPLGALASRAAPILRRLEVEIDGTYEDAETEALAAMLEARAGHPACRPLEEFMAFCVECDDFQGPTAMP